MSKPDFIISNAIKTGAVVGFVIVAGLAADTYRESVVLQRAEAVSDCLMTEYSPVGLRDVPVPAPRGFPEHHTKFRHRLTWCNAFVENGGDL